MQFDSNIVSNRAFADTGSHLTMHRTTKLHVVMNNTFPELSPLVVIEHTTFRLQDRRSNNYATKSHNDCIGKTLIIGFQVYMYKRITHSLYFMQKQRQGVRMELYTTRHVIRFTERRRSSGSQQSTDVCLTTAVWPSSMMTSAYTSPVLYCQKDISGSD